MKTMEAKKTKHISRRFRRFIRANEAVSALSSMPFWSGSSASGSGQRCWLSRMKFHRAIAAIGADIATMGATVDGRQRLDSN